MQNLDEWMAFVSTHLPAPVTREESGDGTIYFSGGEPPEVIVAVGATTISVFEYAVRPDDGQRPVPSPRLIGQVKWRRARNTEMIRAVAALIAAAREARRARFRQCEVCDTSVPPEWMHDDRLCQTCAERQTGTVH